MNGFTLPHTWGYQYLRSTSPEVAERKQAFGPDRGNRPGIGEMGQDLDPVLAAVGLDELTP